MTEHKRKGSVAYGEIPFMIKTPVPTNENKRSPEGGSKDYLALLDKMRDLHLRKNAGYSGDNPDPWANFRMSEEFGVSAFKGVLVRLSDKYIRITNLVKNPNNEQVGESIKDTLMDMASYALIAIAILEEQEDA